MIYLKTAEEIELLRESNLLVSKTLAELAKLVKPGVTTAQLDKIAEEFLKMFALIKYQGVVKVPKEKKKNLSKFICPSCGQFVLGKEQTSVICDNCHEKMATID